MTKPKLDQGVDYERGFVDGMQYQTQSMVYKTIEEWIEHNPNHIGALPIEVCHQIWGTKGKGTSMTKDEALELALEALEEPKEHFAKHRRLEAITAIKEALAQPEQEPVAMADYMAIVEKYAFLKASQRTWVGLTEEEVDEIYTSVQEEVNKHWDKGGTTMFFPFTLYKALEQALKEKNNG